MIRSPEAGFAGAVQAVVQRAAHVTQVHCRGVTGSTNDDALNLARSGAPHGTLIVAEAQSGGRGRQGRSWHSPFGKGLWFSWILRPNLPVERAFWVSAAAGVAIVDAAGRTAGVKALLRWPNDVLAGGRKLAGILAESAAAADRIDFLVLGVGINVNQDAADFLPEIAGEATSLKILGGHDLDRSLVLAAFIEAFEPLYGTLEKDQGQLIRREWLGATGLMGKRVRVSGADREYQGRAVDLAADGALVVEREDGGRTEVRAADVRLLREVFNSHHLSSTPPEVDAGDEN